MSRRFGRNQRRRAREVIAALEATAARERSGRNMAEGLCSDLTRKLSEARDYQALVASIVGEQSVLAGVPTRLNMQGFDGMRAIAQQDIRAFPCSMNEAYNLNDSINYEVLRLLKIDAIRDPIRQMLHARVDLADNRVGYAISEKSLAVLNTRHLVEVIGPDLMRALAEEIVRARK